MLQAPFTGHSKRGGHLRRMMLRFLSLLLIAGAATLPAQAQNRGDQESARAAAEQGQVMPLGRLVAMVQARAPFRNMTYLGGPQFDARTMRYGLKFLDGSKVIVVIVDARTGRVVGQQP
jgi:uncharacterized iron-regulated membrane protein